MINIIIYGSIFIFSYKWLTSTIDKLTLLNDPGLTFFSDFVHVLLLILGFIILLIVCYLTFTIFGGLVSAPFNENLSQLVEYIKTNDKSANNLSFWRDFYISIIGEVQKSLFHLSFLFLFFLIEFIPAAGQALALTGWIIFSCFFNALDFLDYPMTRRSIKFRQKLRVTGSGKWLTYGFGLCSFLLMFLPVVNVFMKPILVVAGTSLYFERGFHFKVSV